MVKQGTCQVNCASGTVWNYLTEKCETEVKATIKVSSALTYFLRCRDADFSVATGDGFKSGSSIKDLQWSLSVDEEVTDYVSDIDSFNELLRTTEVASKGQSKLTLSKLATELILRPVVLKVTASGFEPSHNSPFPTRSLSPCSRKPSRRSPTTNLPTSSSARTDSPPTSWSATLSAPIKALQM